MKKWTVEIGIAECWIDDGFRIEEENLKEAILSVLLGYARHEEVSVKVKKAPKIKD